MRKQVKAKKTLRFRTLCAVLIAVLCLSAFMFTGCQNVRTVYPFEDNLAGETEYAQQIRKQLADSNVTEIEINDTVVVMDTLVVSGDKKIVGTGTIVLDSHARAGKYVQVEDLVVDDSDSTVLTVVDEDVCSYIFSLESEASVELEGITLNAAENGGAIWISKGAKLCLKDDVTVTGGYLCNIYNEGELEIQNGTVTSASGHNIVNVGKTRMEQGEISDCGLGANIYNTGNVDITGGTIANAASHNIYLASGFGNVSGGSMISAGECNIYVADGAEADVSGKETALIKGATGIENWGKLQVTGGRFDTNFTSIRNYSKATVSGVTLARCSVNHLENEAKAQMTIQDCVLQNAGASAIVNTKGSVDMENVTVNRSGAQAVLNYGGKLNAKNLTITNAAGTAVHNMDLVDGTGGNVTIDGLTISSGAEMNLSQESRYGKMKISNASFGLTAVTNVRLISGILELNNIKIVGTTRTGAGVWATGGELIINDALIENTKGRGLALAGGTATGKNLTFNGIENTGIDVMRHSNLFSSCTAEFTNVNFSNGGRDNVAVTADNGKITINGGVFGASDGSNVRTTTGKMVLNGVWIKGTNIPRDNSSWHGVYLSGGTITLNDVTISNPHAGGVRNKGGNVIATNLTVRNCSGMAVSMSAGSTTVRGLTVSGGKDGNILNESNGTFYVSDAILHPCMGSSVVVKSGDMIVENSKILGADGTNDKNAYHNVYATGGKLTIRDTELVNSTSSGIRNAGAEIVAERITMSGNAANNINASKGTTTVKDSTLGVSVRTSVNVTAKNAKVVLENVKAEGAGDKNGNNVNVAYIGPGAILEIYGDTVLSGSATQGGIHNSGGTLRMYDGKITGNALRGITMDANGDSLPVTYIYDGEIYGNGGETAPGGAIYTQAGSLYVEGGKFYNNKASAGGAISIGSGAELASVLGAEIYGNTAADNSNGIRVGSDKVTIGEGLLLKEDVLYLETGMRVKVQGSLGNDADNPLNIAVPSAKEGTVLLECSDETAAAQMQKIVVCGDETISAVDQYVTIGTTVDLDNSVARIGDKYYVTLQAAINAVPTDGTQTKIEIIQDILITESIDVPKDGNRNFILTDDGTTRTITRSDEFTNGRVFILRQGNVMTIEGTGTDAAPTLIFDGKGVQRANESQMIAVGTGNNSNYDATLYIKSGIKITGSASNSGAAVLSFGTTYMSGGVITGNTASANGGGLWAGNNGKLFITGGTISGNTANLGDDVYLHGGTVSMEGQIKIDEVYLTSGKSIGVNGEVKSAKAISVVLPSYEAGTLVLTGEKAVLEANYQKFELPVESGKSIGSDGKISSTAKYVARIGTTCYESLQAAVNAVPTDGTQTTIEIISDIMLTSLVDINGSGKNIIITDDGNVRTVSRGENFTSGRMILIRKGNTVTFQGTGSDAAPTLIFDGKNIATSNDSQIIAVGASTANYNATMFLKSGVMITNGKTNNGAGILSHGTSYISGGVITGNIATGNGGGIWIGNNGKVEITGGDLTGNSAVLGDSVFINNSSNNGLTVGGTLKIDEIYLTTGETVALKSNVTASKTISVILTSYEVGVQVLTGDEAVLAANYQKFAVPAESGMEIGTDGKLIGAPVYVARIGSTKYETLQAAFDAVPKDGTLTTIEILSDIELAGQAYLNGATKNVILTDDGNARTISRAASYTNGRMIIIGVGNTLTLQGTGTDTAPTLIIDGKNITGTNVQSVSVGTSTKNYNADLYLKSGVKLTGASADNGAAIVSFGRTHMSGGVITGNTGTGNGGGILVLANGALETTGGTVSGNTAVNGDDIYISNTMSVQGAVNIGEVYLPAGMTVSISGNVTTDSVTDIVLPSYTVGTQVLTGDATVLAANYQKFAIPESSGMMIGADGKLIGRGVYVARIGNTHYETLQAAVDAVDDNTEATIVVLSDITLDASFSVTGTGKKITLTDDGTVRTITRGSGLAARMIFVYKGNELTVQGTGTDAAPTLIFDGGSFNSGKETQIFSVGTSNSNYAATLNIKPGVKIQNNICTGNGSAVVGFGTVNISGGVITANTSTGNGGGILMANNGKLTITGGTITGNNGGVGDDIYVVAHANNSVGLSGTVNVGEVYLAAGESIALNGNVAVGSVINVVMPSYEAGTQVLTGDAAILEANYQKFAAPAASGVTIGDVGKLVAVVSNQNAQESENPETNEVPEG